MTTPITELILPVGPHVLGSRWGSKAERSEDQLDALEPYTRAERIARVMWAARAAVIREQLREQRGTWS